MPLALLVDGQFNGDQSEDARIVNLKFDGDQAEDARVESYLVRFRLLESVACLWHSWSVSRVVSYLVRFVLC